MGRLVCDVAGDLETLSVGLEPLQIKATRSFETSGNLRSSSNDAASHASSENVVVLTSVSISVMAYFELHVCLITFFPVHFIVAL